MESWRPDFFSRRRANLKTRQAVLRVFRAFFAAQDFDEVETPCLQTSPGNETHLHAFATELKDPHGGAPTSLYLQTSPEFAMKKLLVAGVSRLYQFAHAFRNGERSSRHHPEFIMLEWYRAGASLDDIRQDCVALVRAAATVAQRPVFTANNMTCDPFQDWENLSVPEAFQRYAHIDLLATENLAPEAQRLGVRVAEGDTWEDLFFRIMGEKIEPFLGKDRPTFLCDYPVSMAALAKPKASDPRLAERFELYICGLELANAFDELTDVAEQERRFKADMDLKEKLYGERYPIDPDFLAALHHGMPDSAGIALGFDRLVMLCAGAERLEDVMWLPVVDNSHAE